jgi:LAS superfamily LD-carboxypeptidase LdcB
LLIEWHDQQLTGESNSHLQPFADSGILVHRQVIEPLQQMIAAANRDGIALTVASGFRNFSRQQGIWQAKYSGERALLDSQGQPVEFASLTEQQRIETILRWTALPGTSRHHWGTDFDLYDIDSQGELPLQLEPHEYQQGGPQYLCWCWLQQHAKHYGFYWPYDRERNGVAPEPWHLSFGSVAETALAQLSERLVLAALERNQVAGLALLKPQLASLMQQYVSNVTHWNKEA